jgi:mRNA interferase RelE/StbE
VKVAFKSSFARDLRAIHDTDVLARIRAAIENVEQAQSLGDVAHLRKLQSRGSYYRIRVGDFRLGVSIEEDVVTFVRCLNRSDIYRRFP